MNVEASVPSIKASIYDIEANRNHALKLYETAYDALAEAVSMQQRTAKGESPVVAFGRYGSSEYFAGSGERDTFLERCRQEVDRGIWGHLVASTKLESLMDHKAREEFRAALRDNPPPATVENCLATMERFMEDAGTIFRRGVALAFSGLDRRFRSHDGFKIGSRVVITYAFADYGSMNSRAQEIIRDVERAFYVMDETRDKREAPEYMEGICGKVPRSGFTRQAFVVEDDYFTLKGFKNGNAHLWFKRDDLLDKVNGILAEWYGATLGEGVDVADTTATTRSTAVAKNMGWFPTPAAVVSKVIEEGAIYQRGDDAALTVLEPSAGEGAIAMQVAKHGARVACVELHPGRAQSLRAAGCFTRVVEDDFLNLSPDSLGTFDRVLMNPPFDRSLDVDHVRHAFKFLKPGGILVAVMAASTEFREDAKTVAFRAWATKFLKSRWHNAPERIFIDLPTGSFRESATNVNTCLLALRAPQ